MSAISANISMLSTDDGIVTAESLCVKGVGGEPINFTLRTGDRIGLLGAVGSGKRRLLRTLARMEKPAGGKILWSGVDVTRRPRWALGRHGRDVVLIWSNPYALFADDTSPRRVLATRASRGEAATRDASYSVDFPTPVRDVQVSALSGYQRVRLALAYAERRGARAILLDDVFGTLIPGAWAALWKLLDSAVGGRRGLLIASQYPDALERTDQTLVILDGEIVERGPTMSVLQHPQHAYTQWLTRRRTVQACHVREWHRAGPAKE